MTNVDEMPICAADWLSACREDGQMEKSQPITAEENNQPGEGGVGVRGRGGEPVCGCGFKPEKSMQTDQGHSEH